MRIILVGVGTVGQAFCKILLQNKNEMNRLYGFDPKIVAAVDSRGAAVNSSGLDLDMILNLKSGGKSVALYPMNGKKGVSALDVIEDVDTDAVIEASPTRINDGEPGLSFIKAALRHKRNVVATNKGPLALALPALMELAEYKNVALRFSGTVGAGIPILDFGKKCLLGDRITSIRGILNGTTNYILTRMTESGVTMSQALEEAQKAGYAEADPAYDVKGIDTACKLVIMANWLMGRDATIKDVDIQGIESVTPADVEKAKAKKSVVKLVGTLEDRITVRPALVDKNHPLAVDGALNAVSFRAEFAGEITMVGKGAGGVETAGAVLRDLIDIRRSSLGGAGGRAL
jgi:homoserine dehydrogenase